MSFAYPLPWWGLLVAAGACLALAFAAYARTGLILTRPQRAALAALRAVTLAALVVCLLRPVTVVPPSESDRRIVAVLVDTSRSMALADADGLPRIERARAVARALAADLSREFRVDVLSVGERVARADLEKVDPAGRRSDLTLDLGEARDRYRDAPLAGLILVSDGGETGVPPAARGDQAPLPVFTVGVGSPVVVLDREVRSVTVGPSALDASLVDITVTLVAHGESSVPVRLLQGRRVIDVRDVPVSADGSPLPQTFTVAPDRGSPSVFRVEIAEGPRELTTSNNVADVLVPPPGRQRRVLMLEGLPGFEHSFLKRAWQDDPSVALDSVVRKGRNDQGQDTFYVQAAPGRTAALTSGFPSTREALFAYDAVVLANFELEALPRDAQTRLADFVGERGGGLLVFGSQSLAAPAVQGSPLAPVLPLDIEDRGGFVLRAAAGGADRFKVTLTDEGARHPVMRLAASADETRRKWAALPPLAGASLAGAPRPGTAVLAIAGTATGATVPIVAVQRFGAGRAMIFGGEASWRWKMMMPASDTTYQAFWRQSLRWLAGEVPDPVAVDAPQTVRPGTAVPVAIAVRDGRFEPVPAAAVTVTVRDAEGRARDLPVARQSPARATATWQAEEPGVYQITADARQDEATLGSSEQYVLVGGIDPEFTDPRMNDSVLTRLAAETGGEFLAPRAIGRIGDRLRSIRPETASRELRDLWHNAWSLLIILGLLSTEWAFRRRWGLR